jgi:hypothetical protein
MDVCRLVLKVCVVTILATLVAGEDKPASTPPLSTGKLRSQADSAMIDGDYTTGRPTVGLRAEAAKPAVVAPLELHVAAADAEKSAAADLAAVSAVVSVAVSKAELARYVSQQCSAFSQYSPPPSHRLRAASVGVRVRTWCCP